MGVTFLAQHKYCLLQCCDPKVIAITTRKLTMNALHLGARFAWCNQAVHPTFLAWYREALMCFETGGHCAKIWPAFYHPSHTRIPSRRATGGHYITQNSLHTIPGPLKIQSSLVISIISTPPKSTRAWKMHDAMSFHPFVSTHTPL